MELPAGPSIQTKALLLLLLLVVEGTEAGYEAQDVEVEFNLDKRPISELLDVLRAILAHNMPRLRIAGGAFLAPKRAEPHSPPGRWLKVTLVTGSARATVAIDDGGVHLHAFRDLVGDWHAFRGFESLFPGAKTLPFAESYADLMGDAAGGYESLVHVALGRATAASSVETMSGYDPSSTPDADIRRALATLSLIISEALRFKSVRQTVAENWEGLSYLTMDQVHDLLAWGQISYCLYCWERDNGVWPPTSGGAIGSCGGARRAGVTNPPQTLAKVDLFVRPQEISINSYIY